jgi:hypothetical protein
MADNPNRVEKPDERMPLSTPYGPQYRGVDEAAGGADSSPYEDLPSGQKGTAARSAEVEGRDRGKDMPQPPGDR